MDRASFAYQAIAIREGQLTMMNRDFSREEVDEIIAYLVTWLLYVFHSIFCFLFLSFLRVYLCLCVCTSYTISIINISVAYVYM